MFYVDIKNGLEYICFLGKKNNFKFSVSYLVNRF